MLTCCDILPPYIHIVARIYNVFEQLLERAGITKAELSRRLGLTAPSVTRWGSDAPGYAIAYLELLIEYNRVRP